MHARWSTVIEPFERAKAAVEAAKAEAARSEGSLRDAEDAVADAAADVAAADAADAAAAAAAARARLEALLRTQRDEAIDRAERWRERALALGAADCEEMEEAEDDTWDNETAACAEAEMLATSAKRCARCQRVAQKPPGLWHLYATIGPRRFAKRP